jgi:hypothetical protein
MAAGGRVERRLSWYWQVELANAVLVPLCFVIFAFASQVTLEWPTYAALLPVIGSLIVGGLYWRGKWQVLRGSGEALEAALRLADRCDRPLLWLTLAALGLTGGVFAGVLPASSGGDRWAVLAAALLALAEYVNYYQRQLQHFDNWPDFHRLITGRGLRPAKMAIDLAAWRAAQRRGSEA